MVAGSDATRAVAEMVATLYDASLDAYRTLGWPSGFNVFRQDLSNLAMQFENMGKPLTHFRGGWNPGYKSVDIRYRALPADITVNMWGYT